MISSASARLLPLERMSNTSRREVSKGSSTDNECQTPGKSLLTNLKSSRGRRNARPSLLIMKAFWYAFVYFYNRLSGTSCKDKSWRLFAPYDMENLCECRYLCD